MEEAVQVELGKLKKIKAQVEQGTKGATDYLAKQVEQATLKTTDMLKKQVKQKLLDEIKEVKTKMGNVITEMDTLKVEKDNEMKSETLLQIEKIKIKGDQIVKIAEDAFKKTDKKGVKEQLDIIKSETKKVEDQIQVQLQIQVQMQAQIQFAQQVKEDAEKIKSEANTLKENVNINLAGSDEQIITNALKIKKDMLEIQQRAKNLKQQTKKKWEWDEYYMKIACLAALRSKEPRTPVS